MSRLPLSCVLLVALGLTGAACSDGTMRTAAQMSPDQSNADAASTLKKQEESRYFAGSDALLAPHVPWDTP